MNEAATDRRLLTEEAYPDSTNLRARVSIYDFKERSVDFWSFVLDQVGWPENATVLDVGCGPGNYLAELSRRRDDFQLVGLDLSRGMAAEARSHAFTLVGDVCSLPVRASSVDRLLAPHMLYHAPDLDTGARELRRVLRPGGVALIVTNDRRHLDHLVDQLSQATGTNAPVRFIDRFTLENGLPLLERHFENVRVEHLRGALVVPEAGPVVRYADSCRSLYETQLPIGVTWSESMSRFEELVENEIESKGAWRAVTHSGVFVCQ